MPEILLSQSEADSLISMEKIKVDNTSWEYPALGGQISIPLLSRNKRESFSLDISRGKINLSKGSYQNRTLQVVILLRLDFAGPPHRNPDNVEILSPHLHIYREGFGDKWAIPLPREYFSDTSNMRQLLDDFMRYCKIIEPPNIQEGLFS